MSDKVGAALSKFIELDRSKRKHYLQCLVEECSPYDIFVLQQALFGKGYGGFDIIGALPIEISIKIFEQLTAKDLCVCGEVSKKWRSITKDSSIWKKKCIEMYSGDEKRLYNSKGKLIEKYGWRKVYQQSHRIESNLRNGRAKTFRLLKGHKERINDAKLKEDILVTGSADRTVRIWNVETGECTKVLTGNSFSSVDFLPDEKILAASTFYRSSFIWNMETGELLRELRGHVTAVRCISISKNHVASCAFDGSLIVWNWRTGDKITTIPADATSVMIMDDDMILCHTSINIKMFKLPHGNCIYSMTFEDGVLGWTYILSNICAKNIDSKDFETFVSNYNNSDNNGNNSSNDDDDDDYATNNNPDTVNLLKSLSKIARVFDFNAHKGLLVCEYSRLTSSINSLGIFSLDETKPQTSSSSLTPPSKTSLGLPMKSSLSLTSQLKPIQYPKLQDTIDMDKEVIRTLNIDDKHIIVGYLSGKIGILGFDDYDYDHDNDHDL